MRRTLWLVLTVILLILPTSAALAQTTPPTLSVAVGLDGYCGDEEGWCPVYVVLSNEGSDVEGTLSITSEGTDATYSVPVVLPTHSRKGYYLYLPYTFLSSKMYVNLESDGLLLASTKFTVHTLATEDRLYGVIGDRPSAFNFLSGIYLGGETAVANLDAATLPPDPLGWERLDLLVINDTDTTRLDAERLAALTTWVEHGGHLVVGGGAGAIQTAVGVADLLPVTVNGIRQVENLSALLLTGVSHVAVGPYPVAESTLREDGNVLIEQDGLILIARRAYGDGYVDFLAFDAALNPFTAWDDTATMWTWLLNVPDHDHIALRNRYSAMEAAEAIPGIEPPSTLQIALFTFIYILIIGPVNYLVLRWRKRLERAWLTIPAIILAFTSCAYLVGFQIRGVRPVLNQMAAVYLPAGGRTGRVSAVTGIFSPRRTTYDVQVGSDGVYGLGRDLFGGDSAAFETIASVDDGIVIRRLRLNVSEVEAFVGERYFEMETPATANLTVTRGMTGTLILTGILHNGGRPLQDAVLLVGDTRQALGDLEPDGEAAVRVSYTPFAAQARSIGDRIMGPGSHWQDKESSRRWNFLNALFFTGGWYGPVVSLRADRAYLVGWRPEEPLLPVAIVGKSSVQYGLTLYIYELPLPSAPSSLTGDLVIGPGSITCREIMRDGDVSQNVTYYRLAEMSELQLRCQLPFDLTLREVTDITLDLSDSHGSASIYLWNAQTGEWDDIHADWGMVRRIPSPEQYVEDGRYITIRLKTGADEYANMRGPWFTVEGRQ